MIEEKRWSSRPPAPDLGACCGCNTTAPARTVIMLPWQCAVPGHGWGCLRCGLSANGACVVLCDACAEHLEQGKRIEEIALLQCRGYPASDGRESFDPLLRPSHRHNMAKHPEAPANDQGG